MTLEDSPDLPQHWQPLRLPSGPAPTDGYVQVSRRLASLDAVEREIVKERSELSMTWNRALPVTQLPNELLVSIFTHVAILSGGYESCHYRHGYRYCPGPQWTEVIKVCRHWRDVAYTSPALWRAIPLRSMAYARRALSLSAPATIDVFVFGCQSTRAGVELLRPHAQRLRSLCFDSSGTDLESTAATFLQGDNGMPALETLEFHLPGMTLGCRPRDVNALDIRLTPERFPSLRSLTITLIVAPQDIQVYAHLRRLSLTTCPCDFSFQHFLDVLAASTKLESLMLDSILQHVQEDWVEMIIPSRSPVSLRHLESLVLVNHPLIHTSRFLPHIVLSSSVSVRIEGDFGEVTEEDLTETVSTLLPMNAAATIPALALATSVEVEVYDTEYSFVASVGQWKGIALRIYSFDFFWTRRVSPGHHAAHELLRAFGRAPLTMLVYEEDFGTVTAETWTEIFDRYPLLETLCLRINGTTEAVFAGFMNAAPAPGSFVPCPRLQDVDVSGQFSEQGLEVTLRCLRDRADKGYRLAKLTMGLNGDESENVFFEASYIPQLRELATEVYCSCDV